MAKVNFKNGRVEDYTIVLSTRDKRHLGQVSGLKGVTYCGKLNGANEMSFTVYKSDLIESDDKAYDEKIEKHREYLWENIVDFKLIWVKELDEYFEIKVSLDDSNEIYKNITATSLCEAELSQTMLYNIEINTESDIKNEDYKKTTFYDNNDHDASLLHRILECVPHYSIKHVDSSLCNIQRTFSIDGTSVYDFLVGECSEQFDCLFQFNSSERSISVYDLMTVCRSCGERGEFADKCPECNSTNLQYYGKDTTIYVDKNNLTDSIQLSTNADSIKNCFKLETGDDIITSTVRTLNQNGSDRIYIDYTYDLNKKCNNCGESGEFADKCPKCNSTNWDYTNELIKDMPKELVKKLKGYNDLYNSYTEEYEKLALDFYDLTDKISYYTSSMMPKVEHIDDVEDLSKIKNPKEGIIYVKNETIYLYNGSNFVAQREDYDLYKGLIETFVDARTEAEKLTEMNLSPIGLQGVSSSTSLTTVNSAIKNYAKIYVKTGYVKLKIENGSVELDGNGKTKVLTDSDGWNYGTWHGKLKVTNYSNEEDIAYSNDLSIKFYDNYQDFNTQKIEKNLKSNDGKENSIFDVLSIDELEDFKKVLKLYSHNRLDSFYDALNEALLLLQQMEQSEEGADLYDYYKTYQAKLYAIRRYSESDPLGEDDIRQNKIAALESDLEKTMDRMSDIQSILDFEKYMGNLYPIFCAYKREDKYSNSNYISDGLNNEEIIDKAKEFIEVAKKELIKSSGQQYTLSTTLYNLLVMDEFKKLVNKFELGNWIRVRVDGVLYRLRLISYTINFDSMQTIDVEFSTITKVKDIMSDVESILSSAQSMATSYGGVIKQSENGQEANNSINAVIQNGLNSALVQIKNNNNEEVTYGKQGILLRQYDDIMEEYDPKQCRLTHNAMVYTTDSWKTASLAIGEHKYTYFNENKKKFETAMDYGVTSKFVQAGYIYGTQMIAGDIYSENYEVNKDTGKIKGGSHFDLNSGKLKLGTNFDWDGSKLYITGACIGSKDYTNKWIIGNDKTSAYIYNGTSSMGSVTAGTYLGTDGFRNYKASDKYVNIKDGVLTCNGANVTGTISSSTVSGSTIKGGEILSSNYNATNKTGSYFNLNNGSFSFADGKFSYDKDTSKLSIKDVSIDWSSSTNPSIQHVVNLQDNLNGLSTRITTNANSITSEVTRATTAEGTLSSRITQNASNIELKVSKDGVVSSINVCPESVVISAAKIDVDGVLNVDKLNALKIKAGSVDAESITGTTISGKTISGGTISGSYITGVSGSIGGANMDSSGIYCNGSSTGWGLWGTTAHANIAIHAGATTSGIGSAPFRVYHDGTIIASKGKIGGCSINSSGSLRVPASHLSNATVDGKSVKWQGFNYVYDVVANYGNSSYPSLVSSIDVKRKYLYVLCYKDE